MLDLYCNRIENNSLLMLDFSKKVNLDEERYFIKYQKKSYDNSNTIDNKFFAWGGTSQCQC